MKRCSNNQALRQEKKTWDFMLGQMADLRERERGLRTVSDERGTDQVVKGAGRIEGLREMKRECRRVETGGWHGGKREKISGCSMQEAISYR